jgi:hypothetical protein
MGRSRLEEDDEKLGAGVGRSVRADDIISG